MKCITVIFVILSALLFGTVFTSETEKAVKKRSDFILLQKPTVTYIVNASERTNELPDDYSTTEEIVFVPLPETTTPATITINKTKSSAVGVQELTSSPSEPIAQQIKGESSDLESSNSLFYDYQPYIYYTTAHNAIPVPIQVESNQLAHLDQHLHGGHLDQHLHGDHLDQHLHGGHDQVEHMVKYPVYPTYYSHYTKPHKYAHYDRVFRLGPFGLRVAFGANHYRHPYHHGFRKEYYKQIHLFG